MWFFFVIWFAIIFGIFIALSAILWLDKRASRNNQQHKYMNTIKIRCPGRIVNYFSEKRRQIDNDKEFRFLHPCTHKFFCRIELDADEFYNRASAYMVRDFRRVDGLRERAKLFGLSANRYKTVVIGGGDDNDKDKDKEQYVHMSDTMEIEMDRIFRKHISVPESLNVIVNMTEYKESKGEDLPMDVTVDVCPFKFGHGFEVREDVLHPPNTEDVSITIGHEEMDPEEWGLFMLMPEDAEDAEKLKESLLSDSEDVGKIEDEDEKSPEAKKDE
jgi:hypothetical protein